MWGERCGCAPLIGLAGAAIAFDLAMEALAAQRPCPLAAALDATRAAHVLRGAHGLRRRRLLDEGIVGERWARDEHAERDQACHQLHGSAPARTMARFRRAPMMARPW